MLPTAAQNTYRITDGHICANSQLLGVTARLEKICGRYNTPSRALKRGGNLLNHRGFWPFVILIPRLRDDAVVADEAMKWPGQGSSRFGTMNGVKRHQDNADGKVATQGRCRQAALGSS